MKKTVGRSSPYSQRYQLYLEKYEKKEEWMRKKGYGVMYSSPLSEREFRTVESRFKEDYKKDSETKIVQRIVSEQSAKMTRKQAEAAMRGNSYLVEGKDIFDIQYTSDFDEELRRIYREKLDEGEDSYGAGRFISQNIFGSP